MKKKFKVYEKSGVKEYWIVDPEMETIELYSLAAQGKYTLKAEVVGKGSVKSGVLAGFELSLDEIFLAQ